MQPPAARGTHGRSCSEALLGPTQRILGRPGGEHENGRPTRKWQFRRTGWLAERKTQPRGKARREQARLTLHALGVQPFPRPSRHAKHRQCRLIKQASSQVERWYRDYVVMIIKAHRTRESVVPLGSRVPPLRKPSRAYGIHEVT